MQALHPGGVQQGVLDARPLLQLLPQPLQAGRVAAARLDDVGIRQRVACEAGGDVGDPALLLHLLPGLVAADEAEPGELRMPVQTLVQFRHGLRRRIQGEEQADLRRVIQRARGALQVVDGDEQHGRQHQGDADHAHGRQHRQAGAPHAGQHLGEGETMLGEPAAHHRSSPWSRCRMRPSLPATSCMAWVAINTVTPTWWKAWNSFMISPA